VANAYPGRVLVDTFGRVATDLRVSLTDRCNLRCTYCMPPEGLDWLPGPEVLTDDELVRLVAVAVAEGVTDVRFTGGEPLLRRGLVSIVERVAALTPRPRTSLTTNGIGLARTADALAAAGPTGSTCRWTPSTVSGSAPSPGGTGWPTSSPAWRPPRTPGWRR
jgi:cyclic pyranopterin phosphate synthase